jgi:hypothetical protein
MRGPRSNIEPKLWTIELPANKPAPITEEYTVMAVNLASKPANMTAFSHATLFSPTLATVVEALRKDFIVGFPGLAKQTLAPHPPQSMVTIKGHLDQSHTNQKWTQSQKQQPTINKSDPDSKQLDMALILDNPNIQTHLCFAATIAITGQIYSNQTGQFPIPSSNGNNYLFCLYNYDSNSITSIPLPNMTGRAILKAYRTAFKAQKEAGLTPKLARLDNECSKALKDSLPHRKTYRLPTHTTIHPQTQCHRTSKLHNEEPLYSWPSNL